PGFSCRSAGDRKRVREIALGGEGEAFCGEQFSPDSRHSAAVCLPDAVDFTPGGDQPGQTRRADRWHPGPMPGGTHHAHGVEPAGRRIDWRRRETIAEMAAELSAREVF